VEDEDVLLAAHLTAEQALHELRVALDVARLLDEDLLLVGSAILEDSHPLQHGDVERLLRHVAAAATGCRLRADLHCRPDDLGDTRPLHLRARAHALALELVPVLHEHAPASQVRHQMLRDEVEGAVDRRLPPVGVELLQPSPDREVRADDDHDVREASVAARSDLVEDAPGAEHPHHGRLAGAGRHLAGVARERFDPFRRRVGRDLDPLQQIRSRLAEEDQRLGGFELGEEQAPLTPVAPPVANEVEGRPARAGVSGLSPRSEPLANQVHELELLPLPAHSLSGVGLRPPWIAVEVSGPATSRRTRRRLALLDQPVLPRLVEGRVQDRLLDLERAHSGSSSDRTASSSLPRSSITFTAISRVSPATNGALTVPERWSQTESSSSPFNERFRLSHAPVRGKNACETWNERPFQAVSRNQAGTSSPPL